MNKNFKLVKGYQENEALRMSFNRLAKKLFDLSFEDWYQNGYWKNQYIPYSIIDSNKVVANVSVSIMDFVCSGVPKRYIQLGTVMTEPSYRNQGLIRRLIQEIEQDFQADGWFLFANDQVVDFYPKFGYRRGTEYRYSKMVCIEKEQTALPIPMEQPKDWNRLEQAIALSISNSMFDMRNCAELILFYVTKFMRADVYYIKSQNAYVIAEIYNKVLFLYEVISDQIVDLNVVAEAFGRKIRRIVLGFTPIKKEGYEVAEFHEQDTTLFLKGVDFENFEEERKMFPVLSHT